MGLSDQLDIPAAYLSHGQTQWLEIALLLAQDAELILLDEPTAGMTEQETHKTADICNRLKGKHTIIVVEHDMRFVKEIGDVISVMHQGKLLAEGTRDRDRVQPGGEAGLSRIDGDQQCLRSSKLDAYYGNSRALTGIDLECARWRVSSACSAATASARRRFSRRCSA